MDGSRFDQLSRSWVSRGSRRSTVQGLAVAVFAASLGSRVPDEAMAKKKGKKKKKNKPQQQQCGSLQEPCTGSFSDNTCCDSLSCATTRCQTGQRCCRAAGFGCATLCDCCGADAECGNGKCCVKEGGACPIFGPANCCPGLSCELASLTCQPT